MPTVDLGRVLDDAVQRFLADLRVGVGQKILHRGFIPGLHDGVGDRGAHARAPGDRAQGALDGTAVDDLEEIDVGEERRVFEDRRGDDELDVPRQFLNHLARGLGGVLELLGQYLAHAGKLVLGQKFQDLDGHLA